MIPKIIHYCWLSGDPFPDYIQMCIDSWKRMLPEYEFILWDRKRFPAGTSLWVDQAFEAGKYAFAADYIRLYALYHHGGIYLDCDVEVLEPFDSFLSMETMMCWQKGIPGLEVAAFGVEPKREWVRSCLERYADRPFIKKNGEYDIEVLPEIIENHLKEHNYHFIDAEEVLGGKRTCESNEIPVFPPEYFSPKSYLTKKIELTDKSFCIHHFAGSWLRTAWYERADKRLKKMFPSLPYAPFEGMVRRWRIYFKKHQ